MHLLTWKKPFQKQFLKALDIDQSITIDVYRINSTFARSVGTIIEVILSPYVFVNSMHYSLLFGLSMVLTVFLYLQFFVT